jgi:Flp pilus assembly pilin Flp
MRNMLFKSLLKFQNLKYSDQGQDLVEYALLCSLIALSLIAGVDHVASAVNSVFSNVSSSLA